MAALPVLDRLGDMDRVRDGEPLGACEMERDTLPVVEPLGEPV